VKKLWVIVLLALYGCGDDANVLSNDGSKKLGYCHSNVLTCVHNYCPNGYDIIEKPTDSTIGMIKCKLPSCKEASQSGAPQQPCELCPKP
jgi:hypothetical protein